MAVIKTRPGYAGSIAYDIDNSQFEEVLGSVAGDDTILLIIREGVTKDKVMEVLSEIIPNIR
jgi:transcriptional regulator of arginine metabolism